MHNQSDIAVVADIIKQNKPKTVIVDKFPRPTAKIFTKWIDNILIVIRKL